MYLEKIIQRQKKLFLDPLDDSKKAYAFIEKFYTDILKNRVVDD